MSRCNINLRRLIGAGDSLRLKPLGKGVYLPERIGMKADGAIPVGGPTMKAPKPMHQVVTMPLDAQAHLEERTPGRLAVWPHDGKAGHQAAKDITFGESFEDGRRGAAGNREMGTLDYLDVLALLAFPAFGCPADRVVRPAVERQPQALEAGHVRPLLDLDQQFAQLIDVKRGRLSRTGGHLFGECLGCRGFSQDATWERALVNVLGGFLCAGLSGGRAVA